MKLFRTRWAAALCALLVSVASSFGLVINTDTVISPFNTNYDSLDIVVTNCTLTVDGPHTFNNLQLLNGAVLTHSGSGSAIITNTVSVTNETYSVNDTNPAVLAYTHPLMNTLVVTDISGVTNYINGIDFALTNAMIFRLPGSSISDGDLISVSYQSVEFASVGLFLTVSNNFEIELGGKVDLAGKGFGPGAGVGGGKLLSGVGSGGGHGGYGGNGSGVIGGGSYGTTHQPISLGSGGSTSGGSGGGAAQISVGNLTRIDGNIFVDGTKATNSQMGGGAGGSFWLTSPTLTGAGSISANGGSGELYLGGGGAGGRIAIYANTNLFTGDVMAHGGTGWNNGGAGTIYLKGDSNSIAQVIVDNRGTAGTNTLLSVTGSYDLTVQGRAIVVGTVLNMRNLTVRSDSSMMPTGTTQLLTLTITGDALIETNASLMFDLKGYVGGTGPGTSSPNGFGYGGAGHGGQGGNGLAGYFGAANGSLYTSPTSFGSGGAGGSFSGGAGGGAVSLTVGGTLSLFGQITAKGGNAGASTGGGGAGGSIYLDVGTLAGNGKISADGGNGDLPFGGGGGGGKIAIYSKTNTFTGPVTAFGGYGFMFGGAGTIFAKSGANSVGLLLADNGGVYGACTPVALALANDVVIVGGAAMTNNNGATPMLNSLYIGSNSYYFPSTPLMTVNQNVTIESGGAIMADGVGSNNSGIGLGKTSSSYGSGGGYGGMGGSAISSVNATILGGITYGSLTAPVDVGSSGGPGSGTTPYNYGGAGGGILRMTVTGTLTLNGGITANGVTGVGGNSGGGSGGCINLTVGRIQGSGVISANGGVGESLQGGGGGGGRIALSYYTNNFAGTMTVQGGAGKSYGGAGTIFRKMISATYGELIVDNGGNVGATTPFTLIDCDMTVSGGAIFTNASFSGSLRSLFVGSNSVFLMPAGAFTLTVATNMTIAAGGKFSADGMSTTGSGAGGNLSSTGGGGAFGGNGGASLLGAVGGIAFTATSGAMGGQGGYSTTPGTGGLGGGGVALTVNGNLLVDGKLSANGMSPAVSGAGGGAGGALTLILGKLMGSGIISANGGAGESPAGGGGGGGRVNITYNTNTFTGQITAFGGAGANYGGAGPVSLKRNASQTTQWTVDNGGFSGAMTPFAPSGDSLIKGGAIVSNLTVLDQTCNSLYIATNSSFVLNYPANYFLAVISNVVIEEGGGIVADGYGYSNGNGSGTGGSVSSVGAGGGHGGVGGAAITGSLGGTYYDSITAPTSYGGSGGAGSNAPLGTIYGGAGGGNINILVGGGFTNNGKITANGMLGKGTGSGGGAGGSIVLNVGTLVGKGSISVNGGAGENAQAGGGGGGRVAITYGTNNLTGSITAYGGPGWANGGAGTIYLKPKIGIGQLLIDNGGLPGAVTFGNSTLDQQAPVTVGNGAILAISGTVTTGSLLIKSNAAVTSTQTNSATVNLTINGDVTIEAGGRLHADSLGYNSVSVNGGGSYNSGSAQYGPTGGGGGHGGYGGYSAAGAAGGIYQDIPTAPVSYGGAGGAASIGPSGGGAIRLTINGNLRVDGALSANGQSGTNSSGNGGGAGGSVYVTMGNLRGSGVIQANGGAGDLPGGGGGGGGRIALYFKTNLFAGDITAFGGAGANYGGAGTIYLSTNQQLSELIIDNGGNRGALTPVSVNTRVSILDGAIGTVSTSSTFDSLVIGSNAWLSYSNVFPTITVTKDTVIQKGGGVLLSGRGAPNGTGSGASISSGCGGGGHGGYGGAGAGGAGGTYHDSMFGPINNGGSGGTTTGLAALGGAAFRFVTTQTLVLDGDINVNGVNATNSAGGGGAGGSVWISAGTFTGSGSIQANGGTGKFTGGGGAGGMIALSYNTNTFSGSTSAHGGSGFVAGAAGTIYSRNNSATSGTVLVDNAGITGTNTPIPSSQIAVNLIVQGRANVTQTNRQVFTSLIVAPDGAIVHSPITTNLDLIVLQDAVVNGVITADRNGLTNGPGSGQYAFAGSGGGYGGNGGDSSSSTGGTNYGVLERPTNRGSGGGAATNVPASRTVGGGAIRLQVAGSLTVNGSISSSGGDGLSNNAGGGSGGSIWVTSSSFGGTGSISVNGGNGEPTEAGGGGGGRIAVYAQTNVFIGLYSANGGQGWMNGVAGTVFLGTNFFGPSVVSISITGAVTTAISNLDLQFDSALDWTASSTNLFGLETPNGMLHFQPSDVTFLGFSTLRLSFPVQTAVGNYVLGVKPYIYDIFGAHMSTDYSNSFSIAPLFISGTVMDTNNVPLSGIQLQATGLSAATSDTNGAYTVAVNPTWTGTITPDTNYMFLPVSRSYTNVFANVTNQNYVIVTPDVLKLSSLSSSNNLTVGIFGVSQVKYQAYSSSNLVDWIPYGSVITGSNSNILLTLPMASSNQFFQFRVSN